MVEQTSRIELIIQARSDTGEFVPLRTFSRATESFTDLLAQVATDEQGSVAVEWLVSNLDIGSTVLEVEGRPAREAVENPVPAILRTTVDALEQLEHGDSIRNNTLSYRAVEQVRILASLVDNGAGSIVVRGSGREVSVTETSASRAKALLAHRFRSFGSIEGNIETVSVHEPRPYFNLFHILDNHAIKCRCDDEILAQAKDSLGKRVRIVGTMLRRFDGRAESIEVTELHVMRNRDQLAQVREIRGIYADATSADQPDGERTAHG